MNGNCNITNPNQTNKTYNSIFLILWNKFYNTLHLNRLLVKDLDGRTLVDLTENLDPPRETRTSRKA